MKYFSLIILFLIISCGKKEDIMLPKSNVTVVSNVKDHSPIYIFFRIKGKDTLAEVNRNNSIISTNWILNIDKRLPLRLVIPEVMKLQEKKRSEVAHKNELAENYYSYADSIGKNLAFLPFTKVYYKLEKPKSDIVVFFKRNGDVQVNNVGVKKENLQGFLNALPSKKSNKYMFYFDKEMTFGSYIQNKIMIQSTKLPIPESNISIEEFIY